jgi:hypothetical protein
VEGDLVAGLRHELSEWQRHLMEPVLPANGLPGEQLRSHRDLLDAMCSRSCTRVWASQPSTLTRRLSRFADSFTTLFILGYEEQVVTREGFAVNSPCCRLRLSNRSFLCMLQLSQTQRRGCMAVAPK